MKVSSFFYLFLCLHLLHLSKFLLALSLGPCCSAVVSVLSIMLLIVVHHKQVRTGIGKGCENIMLIFYVNQRSVEPLSLKKCLLDSPRPSSPHLLTTSLSVPSPLFLSTCRDSDSTITLGSLCYCIAALMETKNFLVSIHCELVNSGIVFLTVSLEKSISYIMTSSVRSNPTWVLFCCSGVLL